MKNKIRFPAIFPSKLDNCVTKSFYDDSLEKFEIGANIPAEKWVGKNKKLNWPKLGVKLAQVA